MAIAYLFMSVILSILNLNAKSVPLLFAFVNGVVYFCLLLIKNRHSRQPSHQWLAFLLLLGLMYICPFMLGYGGWYSSGLKREILLYVPFQQVLLIPPVLYFYVRALLDRSFRFSRADFVHFLPAILYGLYSILVFVVDKMVLRSAFFYEDQRDKDFSTWYQLLGLFSLLVYLFASIKVYRSYRSESNRTLSFAREVRFSWVEQFLFALFLIALLRVLFFMINPEWGQFGSKFWYYACFAGVFYFIAISGYANAVRSSVSLTTDNNIPDSPLAGSAPIIENQEPSTNDDKQLPLLSAGEAATIRADIDKIMVQTRLFENPVLTIKDLARAVGVPARKISQVINQVHGVHFNDYINNLRVAAVINRIELQEHNLQTLLGIAFDSGFNSKSTFNRSFKRVTGLTPREYVQQQRKK